jgi:hypothetical protein
MRELMACVTAAVLLAGAGCGTNDNIYPVSGKATYKGMPAAGAALFFQRRGGDPGQEAPIVGIVQADGSFEVVYGSQGKGCPPGDYDVLIEWKRAPSPRKGRSQSGPDRLGGRYADPKHPRLHAQVKAEINQLAPFDLTD